MHGQLYVWLVVIFKKQQQQNMNCFTYFIKKNQSCIQTCSCIETCFSNSNTSVQLFFTIYFLIVEPTGNIGPRSFTGSGLVYPSEPGLSVPITINVESLINLKKKRF